MRIKFLGHSYHKKTNSSFFFIDLLKTMGDVDVAWDESWIHGKPSVDLSDCHDYDLVLVWQMDIVARRAAKMGLKNLVFCPMWDSAKLVQESQWHDHFGTKILNFSRFQDNLLRSYGHENTAYFQYFLDPSRYIPQSDFSTLRAFFWQRLQKPSWNEIRVLLGETRLDSMTLHGAMDPYGGDLIRPESEECARHNIDVTTWFEDKADLVARIAHANLYFAPRLDEGIGMSFLEAMCMGIAVVAHDDATMNEYVLHGKNGYLYRLDSLHSLDFSKNTLKELGRRARATAEIGYDHWIKDADRLREFLLTHRPSSGMARHRASSSIKLSLPSGIVASVLKMSKRIRRR